MRAIRVHAFGGPEVMRVEEVAEPAAGKGQVVVKVRAIGVNPVDTYIRAGKYGPMRFPYTPGTDTAGIVESVGEGVTDFKAGDRVYTSASVSGAYAEKALCDVGAVHRLPEQASFSQGAAVGVAAGVAYYALFYRAQGRAGETVLVHGGTGGVGIAAVQLARAAGFMVIATAGDAKGEEVLLLQGAHHATDHAITERPEELKALANGEGVDIILEMLANQNLASDMKVLSRHGRVMVIGSRGTVEIDPRELMRRNADVRGVTLPGANEKEQRGIYAALTAALEAKTLRPVIAAELPLAEAAKSHQEVMDSHAPGKIILLP